MQDEWAGYWATGRTGFHKPEVHPLLQKYLERLDSGRVLVPLCGKSLDLPWLQNHFEEVVGSEWVEQAVKAFFAEQNLSPKEQDLGSHRLHRANGLSLIQGDFLTLSPQLIGSFDSCWDRAAMVALPPQTRQQYVPHLVSLMKPGGKILLVTYDTEKPEDDGPPYRIQEPEIREAYSRFGTIELVESIKHSPETDQRLREKGLPWMLEQVFVSTLFT
jgi:thiopurine S-methyltransferase